MPAFLALYSATRSALTRSASASSSSSDPKRSMSSSSSAAAAGAALPAAKASPAVLLPGREVCSAAYELMWVYHLVAWGYFVASGEDPTSLKTWTSACEGVYLNCDQMNEKGDDSSEAESKESGEIGGLTLRCRT